MPNRDTHVRAGAIAGVAYSGYRAWGLPSCYLVAEAVGGLAGGIGGGVLPDWIDTPLSPLHRAAAHSMSITGTVGYFLNEQLPQWQANLPAEALRYAQLRTASPSLLPHIGHAIPQFPSYFLSAPLPPLPPASTPPLP